LLFAHALLFLLLILCLLPFLASKRCTNHVTIVHQTIAVHYLHSWHSRLSERPYLARNFFLLIALPVGNTQTSKRIFMR